VDAAVASLAQELAEVGRLVEDEDVPATLERYVARVAATVPGCHAATITVGAGQAAETVAGSTDPRIAYQPGQAARPVPSPVLEVLAHHEPRRLDDATRDQRWPEFSAQLAEAGYRSMLVLPLPARRQPAAAFALFATAADEFGETTHDLVLLFALHAGAVFDNAQLYHDSRTLISHLHTALDTRAVVSQAQGILMHRYGCPAEQAFALLREASQTRNTKLRVVAERLVTGHEADELPSMLESYGITGSLETTP
jgi:GAF domain-containing protein